MEGTAKMVSTGSQTLASITPGEQQDSPKTQAYTPGTTSLSSEQALRTAIQHLQQGDHNAAFALAKTIFEQIDPGHPHAWEARYIMGIVLLHSGHMKEAETHLASVRHHAAKDSNHTKQSDLANNHGLALRALGRIGEAVAAFHMAARLDQNNKIALTNLTHTTQNWEHASYQLSLEQSRLGSFMDFPAHVHLETFAHCNAACEFCPSPVLTRKGTKMPMALIEKVIEDLTAIPLSFQLSPFKVNEPFLDKRIWDVLDLCQRKLPQAHLTLTSNASPLTPQSIEKLSAIPRLKYFWISVNHHDPERYQDIMKLPFARTLSNLENLHAASQKGTLKTRIVLSRVGDGSADDENFESWVKTRFPNFESAIFTRGDWLGQAETESAAVPNVGCLRWFELSITATGTVAHCCMDGQAQFPIGDITDRHVLDVYNDPEYRRLREKTLTRSTVSPCASCAFF